MSERRPTGDAVLDALTVLLPIALAPLLLFPRLHYLWVLALVGLIAIARLRMTGRLVPPTPLSLPLALFAVTVAISAWTTPDLEESLSKITGLVLGMLVFAGVVVFGRTAARLQLVLGAFCACGVAVACLSLVGTAWEVKYEPMRSVVAWFPIRWKGLPGAEEGFNANPVGATMAMFSVLLVLICRAGVRGNLGGQGTPTRPLTVFAGTAAILVTGVLLLSQSRGAWAGLMFGCAALAWLAGRRGRVLAIVAVLSALAPVALGGAGAAAKMQAIANASSWSLHGRIELWSRGLMIIRDFPLTGIGLNVFRRVVHLVYPPFGESPAAVLPHVHNGLLQAAVDIGLPGLAAYVAVWTATFLMLVRMSTDPSSPLRSLVGQGLLAGAIAQAVFQVTDVIPLGAKIGTLWWVMIGLVAAAYRLRAAEPTDVDAGTWPRHETLVWATGALIAAAVALRQPLLGVGIASVTGVVTGWHPAGFVPERSGNDMQRNTSTGRQELRGTGPGGSARH